MAKADAKATIGKTELVDLIASKGQTKTEAQDALNNVLAAITESLKAGKDVNITGFGKFKVTHKPAYTGRNPSSGKDIQIAASNRVGFSVGASLKSAVNS